MELYLEKSTHLYSLSNYFKKGSERGRDSMLLPEPYLILISVLMQTTRSVFCSLILDQATNKFKRSRREQLTMGHHYCCKQRKVKRGLWSPEEDEKLLRYITTYGYGCWRNVPEQAGRSLFSLSLSDTY